MTSLEGVHPHCRSRLREVYGYVRPFSVDLFAGHNVLWPQTNAQDKAAECGGDRGIVPPLHRPALRSARTPRPYVRSHARSLLVVAPESARFVSI